MIVDKTLENSQPRVPLRFLLGSIVGLWVLYFGLASIRGLAMDLEFQGEMLWRRCVVAAIGCILTYAIYLAIRLFDRQKMWVKVVVALVVSFFVAVLLAWANQYVFRSMEERYLAQQAKEAGLNIQFDEDGNIVVTEAEDSPADDGDPLTAQQFQKSIARNAEQGYWQQLIDLAYGRYFLLLGWCALYFAMLSGERARLAERREGEFRQAARDAELRSLRYQVNPHFLFNTLNSLSALILTGKNERAEAMVQSIASFYRQSLNAEPTSDVTLAEEFELQRHYLEIEAVRFPKRLKIDFDLPDDLADAMIPGMILQPLVENSVKYAVAESVEPVTISISAREEFGRLVVSVADDGPGTSFSDRRGGHGIGLRNVRQRLSARFGNEASIASGPQARGYATHIRIPLEI